MPTSSPEGALLRTAAESLLDHLDHVPRAVTRHLLALAADYDTRRAAFAARALLAGCWVRRTRGNGGPGTHGLAHVASDADHRLGSAVAVCGTRLRGRLDWAHKARPGGHGDGWDPCRVCAAALTTATDTRRTA